MLLQRQKNLLCISRTLSLRPGCCLQVSPHIVPVRASLSTVVGEEYGIKSFPSDNSKLAEMEFYLVDDLECDLVVFHPYRTLMTICGKESHSGSLDTEAGEVGAGVQDGARYWGTGEGKLEMQEGALQTAW